jgi:hypothetical protein
MDKTVFNCNFSVAVIASPTLFAFVGRGNPAFTTLISTSISRLLTRQLGLLRRKKQLLAMTAIKNYILSIY